MLSSAELPSTTSLLSDFAVVSSAADASFPPLLELVVVPPLDPHAASPSTIADAITIDTIFLLILHILLKMLFYNLTFSHISPKSLLVVLYIF